MADSVGVSLVNQHSSDKDELFVCPYDATHRIKASRFPYHLRKCKKNYPNVDLVGFVSCSDRFQFSYVVGTCRAPQSRSLLQKANECRS